MMTEASASLTEYSELRIAHPEFFGNLPDPAFEIVFDPALQKKVGAGVIYKDPYVIFLKDAVRFRDGYVGSYIRLMPASGRGGAAVLPVVDGKVVLILHERHATRQRHWEIPRGFSELGEMPEQTARREAVEEIDPAEPEIIDIGGVHADTGATSGYTRLYLARVKGVGKLESNEGIDAFKQVTGDELNSLLLAGEITDSFTLAAILQARVRGLLG
jgi:ADP-ribose pyrophosphatase